MDGLLFQDTTARPSEADAAAAYPQHILKSSPHLKGGGFPSLANARTNRFTDRCAMLTCG